MSCSKTIMHQIEPISEELNDGKGMTLDGVCAKFPAEASGGCSSAVADMKQ